MRAFALVLGGAFGFGLSASAQTEPANLSGILKDEILSPSVANYQVREYIRQRVGRLPQPSSSAKWTADSGQLRQAILRDVVFHGWPKEWVDAPPKFEDLGVTEGKGYRMRKLRYEILPGFLSTAILYEPLNMTGKIPAILNVNGHVGAPGKSVEYKQKRCITLARNGILSLNLEWLSFGELSNPWNDHFYGAHLDLVGTNELGLFYLAMRKGLDYLYEHPNTDRGRLGMTGLSGGGWQTIVLSSLDTRIRAAAPVAGFASILARVEAKRHGDLGDVEQSATDLFVGRDYPFLAAMMAPRPTLLAYNAEDDCCFRAAMAKPLNYDAVRPFFQLYDKDMDFLWHENRDPGTHNYQLDNRMAAYDFFSRQFKLPPIKEDLSVGAEVKSYDELVVGLPNDNLNIVTLAQKLADQIRRDPVPADAGARDRARARLKEIVRYHPVKLNPIWTTGISKHDGVETKSHIFPASDGLTSTAVWLAPIGVGDSAPATIVLNDRGKGAAGIQIADRINRGEQVLAIDLPFTGDAWPSPAWAYLQMIYTVGERPLGIEAGHLIALGTWLRQRAAAPKLRLEVNGMRNQTVGMIAAALEPAMFSSVVVQDGIRSLRYLVDQPVKYDLAADLFSLDLLKFTDLDLLGQLAAPTVVTVSEAKAAN